MMRRPGRQPHTRETFKPEDLNDRGKWLVAEKTKRNAAEVAPSWLKDYPGGPEQK